MMAFVPRGRQVFRANGGFMERLGVRAGMSIGQCDVRIEAIDGLRVRDADLGQTAAAIRPKLSKIHIEGTIFLQHEENMFDRACGSTGNRESCALFDGRAIGRCGRCSVSGGGAGRNRGSALRQ